METIHVGQGVLGQGEAKKSGEGRENAEDYKGNCKKEQIYKPEREKTTEFLCELQWLIFKMLSAASFKPEAHGN